jgi:hypothetical protein
MRMLPLPAVRITHPIEIEDARYFGARVWPDLNDHATLGCILQQVREGLGDPGFNANSRIQEGGDRVWYYPVTSEYINKPPEHPVWNKCSSEVELFVATLEYLDKLDSYTCQKETKYEN